jgi:peptidoglycan/xylan/chitin deacetylase (PgdA/CDA1 family)
MKPVVIFAFSLFLIHCYVKKGVSLFSKTKEYRLTEKIYGDRKQIPVLCYHNIKKNPGKEDLLWISEARLNEQMKTLYDSGYHTVLTDQLYQYLTAGVVLPTKPILLSFDDTHEEHFSIVAPILSRYRFKAVFFPMTVPISKKKFMTAAQIKTLSDSGHVIGCHTWNHPNITTLKAKQWEQQINKPKLLLERITGKPVNYFAYPYGVWNDTAIIELKKRGIKAAFQLTGKQSEKEPLLTIRRLMVSGSWSGAELQRHMKASFEKINQ